MTKNSNDEGDKGGANHTVSHNHILLSFKDVVWKMTPAMIGAKHHCPANLNQRISDMQFDHTLVLRTDEDVTVTVTYHNTTMQWDEFADDAVAMLQQYVHNEDHFRRVETKHVRY